MHISDGVLPLTVTIGGYVASAGLAAWSARRTSSEDLPKVAVVTAAFFVASLIHVPLGPSSHVIRSLQHEHEHRHLHDHPHCFTHSQSGQ